VSLAVDPQSTRIGATLLPRGFLADNVLHFVRVLRAAGMPVGPAKVIDAIAAIEAVGVSNKTDFREALAAVLVSRHEQIALFEQAFDVFWRNPKLLERMVAALLPRVYSRADNTPEPPELPSRLAQAMRPPKLPETRPDDEDEVELDAAFTFSPREVLQAKDFATMTADELAQVKTMLARLKLPLPELPVRRTHAAGRGHRVDLRATLRGMTGAAGAVAPLRFRARIRRTPPLVVLCDISGSMDRYARMLLHFLHAITNDRHRVHTLVFGTRLTNITRHLKHRDVDVALARVTESVQDWAGVRRRPGIRGRAPGEVVRAAGVAEPAVALRGFRGAARRHSRHAASRRRFPSRTQSRQPDRTGRGVVAAFTPDARERAPRGMNAN